MIDIVRQDVSTRPRLRPALESGMGARLRGMRLSLILLGVAVVCILAVTSDGGLQYSLTVSVIYALAVLGNGVVTGGLGELNFAANAWVAVGAYVVAHLISEGWAAPAALLAGWVVTSVVGLLVAIPTVRLRGLFTALVTFVLAFSVPQVIVYLSDWTGGSQGVGVRMDFSVLGVSILGSSLSMLFFVCGIFLVVALLSMWMFEGRLGRTVILVGESEVAAQAVGIRVTLTKVLVWTWAAGLAGLAGGLYAINVGYLTPTQFEFELGLYLFVAAALAGTRSIWAALLGGLLVGTLPNELQSIVPAEASSILFGVVLIVSLIAGHGGVSRIIERALAKGFRMKDGQA